jgi:membrane protease YdiL (CAAX protease family)
MITSTAQAEPVVTDATAHYWTESRGPLSSLAFIAPLLIVYELGVLWLGPQAIRNGADVWLRGLLDLLGLGQYFLLPLLTLGILLGWHHMTGRCWRLSGRVLYGMFVESLLLAMSLMLLAQLQGLLYRSISVPESEVASVARVKIPPEGVRDPPSFRAEDVGVRGGLAPARIPRQPRHTVSPPAGLASRLIAFVGAGIYEEVLFRLTLLPALVLVLTWLGLPRTTSLLWAIVTSSLAFSLAHYVGPYGDAWQWYSFLFRLVAGGFFALLFVYRGFGITAGAHAGYDLLVGVF